MNGWIESLLHWVLAAVLLFWFVGAHNRLVRLRSAALQAYGTLDALMVRQADYVQSQVQAPPPMVQVPASVAQADEAPASALAPGSQEVQAAAEAEALSARQSVLAATAQFQALLGAARLRPLEPQTMAALSTALHVMLAAWGRVSPTSVLAFAPDGTLVPHPGPLAPLGRTTGLPEGTPWGWPEPNAMIEVARAQFNDAVHQYNQGISAFPPVLLAWLFRWRRAAPLV